MNAIERYFSVLLFNMMYKVVLTWESVNKILKCDHSNESYWAVLSCGAVYYTVQGAFYFRVGEWNPKVCRTIHLRATEMFCTLIITLWFSLMMEH